MYIGGRYNSRSLSPPPSPSQMKVICTAEVGPDELFKADKLSEKDIRDSRVLADDLDIDQVIIDS